MRRLILVLACLVFVLAGASFANDWDYSSAYNHPKVPDPVTVDVTPPVLAQMSGQASGNIRIPSIFKLVFGDVTKTDVSIQKTAPNQITVGGSLICTTTPCGSAGAWLDALTSGFACDGTTDDTTAMTNALTTLYNQGGGTLMIPAGKTCLISGQITMPNDGLTVPSTKPIRITSFGSSNMNGNLVPPYGTPNGGGNLDLRFNSTTGKIDSRGAGYLEIDHLTLRDGGSDCAAFIFSTNTVLRVHDVEFYGTALTLSACNDGIVLGGTGTTTDGTSTGQFTGFGTVIKDNFFANLQRAIFLQSDTNGIQIVDNMVAASSGSPTHGAIEFTASKGGDGNYIAGNLIEIPYYQYGIWFNGQAPGTGVGNIMVGNDLWDGGVNNTAGYRFEANSYNNRVISGFNSGTTPFSDATAGLQNTYMSNSSEASQVASSTVFTNVTTPVQIKGLSNNRLYSILTTTTSDEFYQQLVNSANNVSWNWLLKPQGGAARNYGVLTHMSAGNQTKWQIGDATDTESDLLSPGGDLKLQSGGSGKVVWLCGGAANCIAFVDANGYLKSAGLRFAEVANPSGGANELKVSNNSTDHTMHFNANNNGDMSLSGAWSCTNVTPVTVNANVSTDQNLMACTIPAGTLNRVGRTLRVFAAGVYSTPAGSTAQMTLQIKLCTVSGCGSGTVLSTINIQTTALGAIAVTNDNWRVDARLTTQTAGASSTYESHGDLLIDLTSATTGADSVFGDANTATVGTIDNTAAIFLQVTGTFSAASASNAFTQRQLIAETVN